VFEEREMGPGVIRALKAGPAARCRRSAWCPPTALSADTSRPTTREWLRAATGHEVCTMFQVILRPLAGDGLKDKRHRRSGGRDLVRNVKEYAVPARRLTRPQNSRAARRLDDRSVPELFLQQARDPGGYARRRITSQSEHTDKREPRRRGQICRLGGAAVPR
jgi:hypothetical protein